MGRRCFRRDSSGQVLVVSALLVALLLLSTALCVIEMEKSTPIAQGREDDFLAYKQSVVNTVISALANATNGGGLDVLSVDLAELELFLTSHSYESMLTLDYNVLDTAPYHDGVWISWGASGKGVSGAYSSFLFESSNPAATSTVEYVVNITSEVNYSGTYMQLTDNAKLVNLTVNILNEAKPALAQSFIIYFDFDGLLSTADWIEASLPSVVNFGNGTYAISFTCDTAQRDDPVYVSLLCHDQRGILVSANATCVRVE